jgi:hypothetical protein
MQSVESQPTFQKNKSPPSSESKYKPSKKQNEASSKQFLKMEATSSSETSAAFQQITGRHVPEDINL